MLETLFSIFDGVSPWRWVAFAVALLIAEMLTGTFFLIWSGLAAFLVAFALALAPDLSGEWQMVIFAAATLSLIFIGRPLLRRIRTSDGRPALNKRASGLVGRKATATQIISNRKGEVEIDGVRWRARTQSSKEKIPAGALVRIDNVESTVVWVSATEDKVS